MKVINFNQHVFEDFLDKNLSDFMIENDKLLILGIKEGGIPLAKIVVSYLENKYSNSLDFETIICQRPSTKIKKSNQFKKSILKTLFQVTPQFILNRIRVLEHYYLMKNVQNSYREVIFSDKIDFSHYAKILIVDDAVDSGYTLKAVLDKVKENVKNESKIFSLAAVVTNKEACIWPDYTLYSDVLIRFPWSLDG